MKFQKTVLAVALAVAAITSTAFATTTVPGEQIVNQYVVLDAKGNATSSYVYEINGKIYDRIEDSSIPSGFKYQEVKDIDVKDTTKYEFRRGGLVGTTSTVPTVNLPKTEYDFYGENQNWGYLEETVITTTGSSTDYIGQVTDELGDAADINGNLTTEDARTTTQSLKQYLQVGNFEGSNGNNTGVYSAQIIADEAKNTEVYSASALNSQGLTLVKPVDLAKLNPNSQVEVDFNTGEVTISTIQAGQQIDRTDLVAYGTIARDQDKNEIGRAVNVIKFNGEYYTVGANGSELTKANAAAIEGLSIVAGGAATGAFDAETIKQTNTAFVGATQTVYGEKTEKFTNASIITVGSTDTSEVLQAGNQFSIGSTSPTTSVEQAVTTGIVKSEDGKNTYGVVVSQKETGKADKFTEVNADGINTTGVINAADFQIGGVSIVQNIQTSVGEATQEVVAQVETQLAANQTFVTEAVAAVDAGLTAAATDRQAIRAAAVEGDAATLASANAYTDNAVAGFNSRVGQLNSRIDDVEKTSYRGIAIALATQQQIPNIGAGQYAVFGGVGHYEGESAAALGVASVLADGRTSLSAALGFGGSEVGGRVGVSYVFGGK